MHAASSPTPTEPPAAPFIGIPQRSLELPGFTLTVVRDDAGSPVDRHTHDVPQLCLVSSDGYLTSARGARGRCGRGTFLYHPAGTVHEDRFERRGGRFFVFQPGPEFEADRLPRMSRAFFGSRIELLCEQLGLESTGADAASGLVFESMFLELLGIASKETPSRHSPSWLAPTLEWIRESESIPSVAELARFACVHPVSFARTFRHHQGISPSEYLRWARIQRVLPALRGPERSLADLALEAGFSDQTAFTRACRRVLSVTPGEYRRRAAH